MCPRLSRPRDRESPQTLGSRPENRPHLPTNCGTRASVTDLASVRAVTQRTTNADNEEVDELVAAPGGDDDDPDELDALPVDELRADYYDDAFGSFS